MRPVAKKFAPGDPLKKDQNGEAGQKHQGYGAIIIKAQQAACGGELPQSLRSLSGEIDPARLRSGGDL